MVDYYLEIIKKLDKFPQETPKIEGKISQSFLDYLKLWISPEEAEFLSYFGVFPSTTSPKKVAKSTGKSLEDVNKMIDSLLIKGAIMKQGKKYSIHFPIVIFDAPMIDDIPGDLGKKFAELSEKFYFEENWARTFTGTKNAPLNRVIPVIESIESSQQILASEEIFNIIDEVDYIAVVPCACRNRMEKIGTRKCDFPIETCLLTGFIASYFVERGKGREISKEDAKKMVVETSKMGLVHITENFNENSQHFLICSCCDCCCCILQSLTKLNNPHSLAKANFIAKVNEEVCFGCGICVDKCKFGAIKLEEKAIINENNCMGCGICATTCDSNAIKLFRKERSNIPLNLGTLMMQMMEDSGKDVKDIL
ncbi:MAG: hypothetical protein EAX96_00290 [Candidatus Lokiarchaeota archaeon]|nr:hypothetical protein [Candidatus Lokiarchaeota archaeon]